MGDYHPVVERLALGRIGAHLVARVGVGDGMAVLDVATGTGNVALAAAAAGARVCALDFTRRLLLTARQHADQRDADVRWVQGDAASLPFPDACFDRVLSTLGVMFVPDHSAAAAELVRVCRPGGVVGLCNWTPGSIPDLVGATLASNLSHAAAPVAGCEWGDEQYVRSLFAGDGRRLELERANARIQFESAQAYIGFLADHAGPVVAAKHALTAAGRWGEVSRRLAADLEARNRSPGVAWSSEQEYLVAVVHTQ